jgi:Rieske Fe-S protein
MTEREKQCGGCVARSAAVSRRDFVSMATMSAVAATLTACGGGGGESGAPVTGPISPGVGQVVVTVTDFPALATVGGVARVRTSPPVAMARTAAGPDGLVAYSLSCTHQGTTVQIQANNTLRCPNHGAEFNSAGVWTGGTQRTTSLVRLPVVVDGASATITLG